MTKVKHRLEKLQEEVEGLQRMLVEVCGSKIFVGDQTEQVISREITQKILKFQKTPVQQTAQGMRNSPEGSLWHFSVKSKDGKKRENFRRPEGSEVN